MVFVRNHVKVIMCIKYLLFYHESFFLSKGNESIEVTRFPHFFSCGGAFGHFPENTSLKNNEFNS